MLLAFISYDQLICMRTVRGKQEVNLSLFLVWSQKTKVFKNKTMTNAWEIYKNLKSGFTKIAFDLSLFGILSPCEDNGNQNVSVLLWSMLWTMSMVHLEAFERGSKNYTRPFHFNYAKQEVTLKWLLCPQFKYRSNWNTRGCRFCHSNHWLSFQGNTNTEALFLNGSLCRICVYSHRDRQAHTCSLSHTELKITLDIIFTPVIMPWCIKLPVCPGFLCWQRNRC